MQEQIDSPFGTLTLTVRDALLVAVTFDDATESAVGVVQLGDGAPGAAMRGTLADARVMRVAIQQFREYVQKKRSRFRLPLGLRGTAFQRQVWETLMKIPYGETWTYAQQAKFMGRPTAQRAVGAANGKNPLPIVIPCHRVIGASGKLVGFASGVEIKRALLEHEGAIGLRR